MMPASEGPSMFLPGSMEWQAWHFLKTRRPAEASPVPGTALEAAAVAALEADGGAFEAGGAGDCPLVPLGDGVSFAAMWLCAGGEGAAAGDGADAFAAGGGAGLL